MLPKFIENFLNRTTMYRLVLYVLIALWLIALAFCFFKILPYSPLGMLVSLIIMGWVAWIVNEVFARTFEVPANAESIYITVFILALIMTPLTLSHFPAGLAFVIWAPVIAMASKFIFAPAKKHIWNPAAAAVVITSLTMNQSASWWIGSASMVPFVLVGGLLIVKKIIRTDLMVSFFAAALTTIFVYSATQGYNLVQTAGKALFDSPIFFFAFVMLTEPFTTPPTKPLRILYGILVGVLFAPWVHIGSVYSTPELALVAGNIFAYAVSPKQRHILKLKDKTEIGPGIYEFSFIPNAGIPFRPGQYLEWTLPPKGADTRGNRRYFTIASAPTEVDVKLGVKFYEKSSSFKRELLALRPGDTVVASQRAGDFTLPRDPKRKLVFLAGGIGITPFRSMVKYLLDSGEKRDITLVYCAKTEAEVVYTDVFASAANVGMKTICVLSDIAAISPTWPGERGILTGEMISRDIPDYRERLFYISGPHAMVSAFEKTLHDIGVERKNIKTDFFPGFV